jgi:hypothetical protein
VLLAMAMDLTALGFTGMDGVKEGLRTVYEDRVVCLRQIKVMTEIALPSQEQARTAQESACLTEATDQELGQSAAATQQLAATADQIARTATDLSRISEALAGQIGEFKVN